MKAISPKEIGMGIIVENEHTENWKIALKIALDHLKEDPSYYTKLKRAGLADELKGLSKAKRPLMILRKSHYISHTTHYMGMPIVIENPKGSLRHWHDPLKDEDGTTKMKYDYGYFFGTNSGDGKVVDVYIGPHKDSRKVFVVDQVDPRTGVFDENKVMLGTNSKKEAKEGYLQHYNDPRFFGDIHEWDIDDFYSHIAKKEKHFII